MKRIALAFGIVVAACGPAFAHLDPGLHGSFAAGVSHPLFGADHILAMVAVGLWAAMLGGGALWLVPTAFVAGMLAGFVAAVMALSLPFVEPVILASVIAIGLMVAAALRVPVVVGMIAVGAFSFFHGHAHGGELGAAGALPFAFGFTVATAHLHATGITLGLCLMRAGQPVGQAVTRIAGAFTAVAGVWLAAAA